MNKIVSLAELKKTRKKILKEFNLGTRILGIPAPYLSYFFTNFTRISANQMTMAWVALATLGIFLIALGDYTSTIIGVIIFHFSMMFDQVDGDIARARKKKTVGGPYIDWLALVFHRALLLAVVGIGLYNAGHSILFLYFGLISAAVWMFTSVMEVKIKYAILEKGIKENTKVKNPAKKANLSLWKALGYLRPGEPFNVFYILLIFNLPIILGYTLIAYSALILILLVKKFVAIYKKYGNVDNS